MPLPASLAIKTLHGRYSALPNGDAPTGRVDFVAPAVLRVTADDTIVLPTVYTATVANGQFTALLPATDDPAISPTGWTYEVVERLTGHPIRRYRIAIPVATVGTLELADIPHATTIVPTASYATTADIVALDARLDELEAAPGGGVTDHGALTGLADDDHGQYYNAARLTTALSPYATTAAVTTGLASKSDTGHTHTQGQVTGLTADLAGKAATVHTHAQADVTGLTGALDGKANTAHSHAQSDVTGLADALDDKADAAHVHAQADVTGLTAALAGKAATAHTHATADVTGLDAALAGKAATAHTHIIGDTTGLSAALAALATKPTVRSAYITTGDVALPDTSGAWSRPGEANGLPAGFTLDLPAAIGDWVELGIHAMKSDNTQAFLDGAVLVGTSVVRYLASGTSTPAVEGDPAWYPPPFKGVTTSRGFIVEAGHLDSGSVKFILANKTAGGGTLYASASFPFHWVAKNLGPVN